VLIAGWILGLPVPWLLIFASGWWLVVVANLLLGANQGLAWSMTVTSKIDLVGPNHRGLALGINEFTGYLGVAMATAVSGLLAARFGLRPTPLLLAAAYTVAGLLIPLIFIRETLPFARLEGRETGITGALAVPTLGHIFWRVTWADRRLFACNQAGMLNKFSDTAMWALVPLVMARQGFGSAAIGLVAGLYAATWGVAQLGTGVLSDHIGRKHPIVGGLVLNAAGLAGAGFAHSTAAWLAAAMAMGLGTSLVYPVLLAAVSDATEPAWRATALGVYRMWRDGGYALGGLAVGWASAVLAPRGAFFILAAVLLGSSLVVTISLRAHRSVRNTAST
jgi:MFS family permease